MNTMEWLRPATAAARFDVSQDTLARWAKAGKIGWTQPAGKGTAKWYSAQDIWAWMTGAAIHIKAAPAQASEPITITTGAASWRDHDLWRTAR